MKKLAALLLSLVLVAGCNSASTLDCSSQIAFNKSMKQISDKMSRKESGMFNSALTAHTQEENDKLPAGQTRSQFEVCKDLEGMNGQQIINKMYRDR
jgi:uncharacterized protein YcfL